MEILRKNSSMIMVIIGLLVFLILPTWAQDEEDVKDEITNQTIMIDRVVTTLDNFLVDRKMAWFRKHIDDS